MCMWANGYFLKDAKELRGGTKTGLEIAAEIEPTKDFNFCLFPTSKPVGEVSRYNTFTYLQNNSRTPRERNQPNS